MTIITDEVSISPQQLIDSMIDGGFINNMYKDGEIEKLKITSETILIKVNKEIELDDINKYSNGNTSQSSELHNTFKYSNELLKTMDKYFKDVEEFIKKEM